MDGPVEITVFSDFTDPACYVTESALRASARELPLSVTYRALETHPAPGPLPPAATLAERVTAVRELAGSAGAALERPPLVPRTRKAHEAARIAAGRGKGDGMREAIFRAYREDRADIGRVDVLVGLGAGVGLDPDDVRIELDIDLHSDAVAADARLARRLGLVAVPTIYIGQGPAARILVGLQTPDALDAAIRTR